jgi:hypothetical protein
MSEPGLTRSLVNRIIALYAWNQALAICADGYSTFPAGRRWLEEMRWLVETDIWRIPWPMVRPVKEAPTSRTPDVERAALDILATGRRPSVETVREALGRGSPATIATCLKRFWRDLGIRAQGDPAALTRIPSEIIEAVEKIWQRSLALSAQGAKHDDNAARERERALADSRDHLLSRCGCWRVIARRFVHGMGASPHSKHKSRITAGNFRRSLSGP